MCQFTRTEYEASDDMFTCHSRIVGPYLLHVTLLTPTMRGWRLGVWKNFTPLLSRIPVVHIIAVEETSS